MSEDAPEQPTLRQSEPNDGVPVVAVLLSWFVPGAGHLYLGRTGYALAAFLLVEGLYALGYLLSDGLVFQFLDPELRGPAGFLLTPEIGNLGALLAHVQSQAPVTYPPTPAVYPPAVALGGMLTAASGIFGALVIAEAHWSARRTSRFAASPALDAALTWLVPGLGHLRQGRKLRGVVVFAVLVGVLVLGCILSENSNLSRERHFYYWSAQFLIGGPALVGELLFGGERVTGPVELIDIGLYYGALGGLLNVLAMLDAYAWRESVSMGLDPVADRRAKPEATSKQGSASSPMGSGAGSASGSAADKYRVGGATKTDAPRTGSSKTGSSP